MRKLRDGGVRREVESSKERSSKEQGGRQEEVKRAGVE